jgi:hypothetical protein
LRDRQLTYHKRKVSTQGLPCAGFALCQRPCVKQPLPITIPNARYIYAVIGKQNTSYAAHQLCVHSSYLLQYSKITLMKFGASLIIFNLFLGFFANAQKGKFISLFVPQDKENWYVFIQGAGKDKDSLKVFQFENGIIHVSGEKFAYISTTKSYSNFHLTLEFKWGEKKYPPRLNAKRDAGVLYNALMYSGDKIWPRSLEFQIQEGDCGDIWLTDSASMIHADTIVPKRPSVRIIKYKDAEKPNGEWNKVEVIVKDGKITHLMNGVVVNEGKNPSPSSGQIVLQSEGAEIYYRNVTLQEL